jgi:hypothetical protein
METPAPSTSAPKTSTGKFLSDMSPQTKGILAVIVTVAGVGALGFVSYKVYQAIKTANENKAKKKEITDTENQIKNLASQGIKTSFNQSQLDTMANNIQVALGGLKTDEASVFNILNQVKNEADLLELQKTFGVRTIKFPVSYMNYDATLGQAVSKEMPTSSMFTKSINDINEMFQKKKIKIQY